MKKRTTILLLLFLQIGFSQETTSKKYSGLYFNVIPTVTFVHLNKVTAKIEKHAFSTSYDTIKYNGSDWPRIGIEFDLGYKVKDFMLFEVFIKSALSLEGGLPDINIGGSIGVHASKWLSIFGRLGYYNDVSYLFMDGLMYGGGISINPEPRKKKYSVGFRAGLNYFSTIREFKHDFQYGVTQISNEHIKRYMFDVGIAFQWEFAKRVN